MVEQFVVERNKNWMPKIIEQIEKEATLIAVGKFHLPSGVGLLARLIKAGYRLEQLDLYGKTIAVVNPKNHDLPFEK